MNRIEEVKMLKKIINECRKNSLILPTLNWLRICYICKETESLVLQVLKDIFPLKLDYLQFYAKDYYPSISYFIREILAINTQITSRLNLNHFKVSKEEFEDLINAFSHIDRLSFSRCTIDSENVSFKNSSYSQSSFVTISPKLRILNLNHCGLPKFNDWARNPQKFIGIIKAISESELRYSLKEVWLKKSCLEESFINATFNAYGLNEIQITFEDE